MAHPGMLVELALPFPQRPLARRHGGPSGDADLLVRLNMRALKRTRERLHADVSPGRQAECGKRDRGSEPSRQTVRSATIADARSQQCSRQRLGVCGTVHTNVKLLDGQQQRQTTVRP
jgi:hypothetical protein